jgi:hypothetical protein
MISSAVANASQSARVWKQRHDAQLSSKLGSRQAHDELKDWREFVCMTPQGISLRGNKCCAEL